MVSRPLRGVSASERGAADIWMVLMMSLLIAFAGLAYDMGMVFNARREVTNIAGSAARAAANEVDEDSLYSSGVARINEGEAATRAQQRIPPGMTRTGWDVSNDNQEVWIQIETTHETLFLGIFGYDNFVVSGQATARAQNGTG